MSDIRQEQQLLHLSRELDAATVDGSRWRNVCDALAGAVGGVGTALLPFESVRRGPWLVHSDSLGESVETYLREEWWKHDLRDRIRSVASWRGYATDHDIVDEDVIRKHPYYADFLARNGLGVFIGIHVATRSNGEWIASIQRPLTAGSPSRQILETIPHIHNMLSAATRASEALTVSHIEDWRTHFDAIDRGIAVLKPSRLLGEMNAAAERLLEPFMRRSGEVFLPDEAASNQLALLIAGACAPLSHSPLPPPVLLRPTRNVTLVFEAVPLPSALRHFHSDAAAILVVRLAETLVCDLQSSMARKFGLTPAEARLAERIGAGESLREVADAEGITFETARTRLKAVFAKTGTSRQTELALLTARISQARAYD
jgi:DNA-binding CsgD family transcriptional regulator